MINGKNAQASIGTARLISSHAPFEILHDLRNCMSILLLCVGDLKADAAHIARGKHSLNSLEILESMIENMNGLLQALAESFADHGQRKKINLKARA